MQTAGVAISSDGKGLSSIKFYDRTTYGNCLMCQNNFAFSMTKVSNTDMEVKTFRRKKQIRRLKENLRSSICLIPMKENKRPIFRIYERNFVHSH